jgi:hypothetical protein
MNAVSSPSHFILTIRITDGYLSTILLLYNVASYINLKTRNNLQQKRVHILVLAGIKKWQAG